MVDGVQLYPYADGALRPVEGWVAPRGRAIEELLQKAFVGYSNCDFEQLVDKGGLKRVLLKMPQTQIEVDYIAKAVSGGGRPHARPAELRIQIDPGDLNTLVDINKNNGIGLIIGVYKNEKAEALAIWRPAQTTTAAGNVSKQIAGETLASALVNGMAKAVYPGGDTTVYAIHPEFFRGFVLNIADFEYEKGATTPDGASEDRPRNLIYFGAPGTGKSYNLNERAKNDARFNGDRTRRITFHPDYTYAHFVGCYKPFSDINAKGEHEVHYKYTFGPFLETYVDALRHPERDYLLIIEEINRANTAAVFGDVFQLLDRGPNGVSEYGVRASRDMGCELFKALNMPLPDGSRYEGFTEEEKADQCVRALRLPSNLYIWATMNSADQGVFPMDTAFKRRWNFEYVGVDCGEAAIADKRVLIGNPPREIAWNDLRKLVNKVLVNSKVNEDKLIGPFFIRPENLDDPAAFSKLFKEKVLLYIFEDAAKTKHGKIFKGGDTKTYSELCADFDEIGEGIFSNPPWLLTVYGASEAGDESAEVDNEIAG